MRKVNVTLGEKRIFIMLSYAYLKRLSEEESI